MMSSSPASSNCVVIAALPASVCGVWKDRIAPVHCCLRGLTLDRQVDHIQHRPVVIGSRGRRGYTVILADLRHPWLPIRAA